MKRVASVTVAVSVIAGVFAVAVSSGLCQEKTKEEGAGKNDRASLQGVWVCTKVSFNGQALDATDKKQVPRPMTVTFDGEKIVFAQGEDKGPGTTYGIDQSKSPKAIDIGTAKGIYAIDGDSLKLKYFKEKDQDDKRNVRPTDFGTKEGDGFASFEFKRQKQ
ncbi:MAG TPA: hypothetical protein DDY78_07335 [Planctomycetales bacterium]|jgi:uncharacterized protein (TIGR03067 family)|nr:hypothetical protein [Planctomycetales bacterium]